MLRIFAITLCALLFSSQVRASPIHYDESTDGDLPEFDNVPVFVLDLGANTIRGSTSFLTDPSGMYMISYDFDSFGFVVPRGDLLVDVSVQLMDRPGAGEIVDAAWFLFRGSTDPYNDVPLEYPLVTAPGIVHYSVDFPLPGGQYSLGQQGLSGMIDTDDEALGDYLFTLEVAPIGAPVAVPVPEPEATWLVGIGLVLMGASRRRSRVMAWLNDAL